ncbi:uncharacterized protein LOC143206743 isoform X2 [Rhynchophorus ferrugineus]|uniref:uncharacterized protein LOC143206743 isoform X2 n=1 Tax=Rhynchophorus ferrugineus TaxID=354439 RepID=UPI003FCDAA78
MKQHLYFYYLLVLIGYVSGLSTSCYTCWDTDGCRDPFDYHEISSQKCADNNICVKYTMRTKNSRGLLVGDNITYRQCYENKEDACDEIKNSTKEILRKKKFKLVRMACYSCDSTNCNTAQSTNTLSITLWIVSFYYLIYGFK